MGRALRRAESWSGRAQTNRFLVDETATLPPGRALDLACGEGRNAVWLAERGWPVTGVDFSEVGLDKAGGLASARRASTVGHRGSRRVHAEPRRFDLVLVFYLQVPADQRRAIVRTVAEAVAPGGMFLLVAHDSSNLEHGRGGPQDPAVLYTASDVVANLDGSGLHIERAETVRRPVDTPDGERVALDALVRGRRASGGGSSG